MKVFVSKTMKDYIVFTHKVRDYEQFLEVKLNLHQILQNYSKEKVVHLFLTKCLPLEPYFLGHLLKLKENDSWNIKIHTNEPEIFKAFEKLALSGKFEVTLHK